ncbi:mercury(II) reductase [Candidatus Peregrinibacteria bacterium]|nr:mercury(II) reductase [Candidatus Peregrinibacteria bacterium]
MGKFDLIIIGGGAGAFAAAIKANDLNAKTLMVNDGLPLGGTCVNVGCVPSKTLLFASELMHHGKNHGIPGIKMTVNEFDFAKVVEDELRLVETLRTEKYQKVLANLPNIEFVNGRASFISENAILVNKETYEGAKFIIATGSTARLPDAEGAKASGLITHIEALKLKKQPKEMVVLGGGIVALEFSQMYARFGTKVTILHHSERFFRAGEAELVSKLAEILTKEGIEIKMNVGVKKIRIEKGRKILTYTRNDKEHEIATDEILSAIGKTPNTTSLSLDKIGVETDEHRAIKVQPNFQTTKKHIYAVGDVTNQPLRLETTAGAEGSLAAENALKGTEHNIDYDTVPYTIFTDPQMAGVGLTEDRQMEILKACACRTVTFGKVPKAIIMKQTEGMIKMALHPETRVIMGVHILAPQAGELIAQAMMLIKNKNTIDDVVNSLPMFPTLSEAIKIAALSFTKDINKLSCCV